MAKKGKKKSNSTVAQTSVMSRFELKQIRCIHSETNLNIRIGPLPKKTHITVRYSIDVTKEQRVLKCNVICEITSFYEDSDKPAISLQCHYQVVYGCKTKSFPSKKVLEEQSELINSAATFCAWPFIRQYAHWMTTQMGLPALVLPMMFFDISGQRVGLKDD